MAAGAELMVVRGGAGEVAAVRVLEQPPSPPPPQVNEKVLGLVTRDGAGNLRVLQCTPAQELVRREHGWGRVRGPSLAATGTPSLAGAHR